MYSKKQFFFMEPIIRKATGADIDSVTEIYELIHTEEEAGRTTTGWKRGVYPTRAVAEAAVQRGDLFVMEAEGRVSAAAIINHAQVDIYAGAPWQYDAPECCTRWSSIRASRDAGWAARLRRFMSAMPSSTVARICASTPTRATRRHGGCTRILTTAKLPSFRASLTD